MTDAQREALRAYAEAIADSIENFEHDFFFEPLEAPQ